MPSEPIQLKALEQQPVSEVVQAMQFYLDEAKAGRLRGVILLGVQAGGSHIRTSKGEMGDANAVYLAQLVIHDGIESAKDRETSHSLPEFDDEETDDD